MRSGEATRTLDSLPAFAVHLRGEHRGSGAGRRLCNRPRPNLLPRQFPWLTAPRRPDPELSSIAIPDEPSEAMSANVRGLSSPALVVRCVAGRKTLAREPATASGNWR